MNIRKSKVKYFDSSFSATVDNEYFKTKGRRYGYLTLSYLFQITDENIDSVHISFNDIKELKLTYTYKGQEIIKTIIGNFAKKGYYEIYFSNEKTEIPPLLPIIYSNYNINRIRLALTTDGNLIVDHRWDHSGNIFILAAGNSGRVQSFFKCKDLK
jgi:hypothetical protein